MAADPTKSSSSDRAAPGERPLEKFPKLKKHVENTRYCADCDSQILKWASVNLGLLLCTQCAGVHRMIGVHITQVRSLLIDKWKPSWVKNMRDHKKFNDLQEYHVPDGYTKPRATSSRELREKYIKAKYVGASECDSDGVAWTSLGMFSKAKAGSLPEVPPLFDDTVPMGDPEEELEAWKSGRSTGRTSGLIKDGTLSAASGAMSEMSGILFVKVMSVTGCPKADLLSASDPYVVFDAGHQQPKTKHIEDNNDPVWDPPAEFSLTINESQPIRITVWDYDVLSADDMLCYATLNVSRECDLTGEETTIEKPMILAPTYLKRAKKKKKGKVPVIKFSVSYSKLDSF